MRKWDRKIKSQNGINKLKDKMGYNSQEGHE